LHHALAEAAVSPVRSEERLPRFPVARYLDVLR
jgi:hypothetical protein